AGAQALPSLLKAGDTVAVAWGRTVLSVGESVKGRPLQDMTVVQATGGMNATFAYTPELCAAKLADALAARCVNLTAPAVVATPQLRSLLLDEPLLKEQFSTLR